ncbi:hypothetical protein UMM65_09175 [Aureibaculum sp. 2210JD6-5]|uniref:hypothetical protein n=1 Tax=Aureibaculum sp. 2210JD6-5 TaxID=3103957 RepID=UPI002AACFCC9|nr:hypothetical protein [Aureibaculum sp. 2210JD6-5]MDY7395411.1 hypothetical protein [Aureibaculum sp. 2210JD6-5]
MNRFLVFVLALLILLSCTKEQDVFLKNPELIGKWKLIEQLADPGDGSGTFMPVESYRTVEFFKNGKVVSNGSLCDFSSSSDNYSEGIFNDVKQTIRTTSCENEGSEIIYELKNSELIFYYLCIEGCAQKFEKISN